MESRHSNPASHFGFRKVMDVVSTVAILIAAGVVSFIVISDWLQRKSTPQSGFGQLEVPSQPVNIADIGVIGSGRASTVLIAISDYECPACGSFARDSLPALIDEFVAPGQLDVALINYPIAGHKLAPLAAEAAECSRAQGRLPEMHHALFAIPLQLERSQIVEKAASVGVDRVFLEACLADGRMKQGLAKQAQLVRDLKVLGTPAFFVGRRTAGTSVALSAALVGAKDVSQFRSLVGDILNGR